MKLLSFFKTVARKLFIGVERLEVGSATHRFFERIRENFVTTHLLRIGGSGDGGYLVPDILEDVKFCFSPGVDYTANFEKQLSEEFDIKSFMADASVSSTPLEDKNFSFIPKYLGSESGGEYLTLSDWVNQSIGDDANTKMLQMDIEGAEYDVLTFEDSHFLSTFACLVIEFHGFHKIFERDFLRLVSANFEKLYKNFVICHIHPNNCCGEVTLDGLTVPRVLEVTFLNRSYNNKIEHGVLPQVPHPLDRKNIEEKPDLILSSVWSPTATESAY